MSYAPEWHKTVGPFSMHLTRDEDGSWLALAHYLGNQCLVRKNYRKDAPMESAAWTLITDLQLVIYHWGKSLEGLRP